MLQDKLPEVGTTIFTIMTSLAKKHQALNLGQGFPDFACDFKLKNFIAERVKKDFNQYAPMQGIPELRRLLQTETEELYNASYDFEEEITITSGATEALFNAIASLVFPGDEVIVFEPAYDSYVPAIRLNGGIPVPVPLLPPKFQVPLKELAKKITNKTKLIILNTPHNPIGKVWTKKEIQNIWNLIKQKNIFLISDEVYEHIYFDSHKHFSVREHPELRERSFIIGSFGKSLHITGWKIGYAMAPKKLMRLFRKIHQFNVFSSPTPLQYAIADYISENPNYKKEVRKLYQNKRNLFYELVKQTPFIPLKTEGTYFMLLDYSRISRQKDTEFVKFLVKEKKVAMIPISVFYSQKDFPYQIVRVCFAKTDSLLKKASEVLR